MEQLDLQARSFESALEADVYRAGGWTRVAKVLFPAKYEASPSGADRFLRNCINQNHSQKLDPAEMMILWKLVRDKGGVPASVQFICDELHLSEPKVIEPEDKRAQLQREYIDSVKKLEALAQQLGKVS